MACRLSIVAFAALLPTASACNGDESFCVLPFTKFTFPGSHNSGSFDLNIPEIIEDDIPIVDVNNILSCFYDTHHMNYLEQLRFGMRWFWPDVCTRKSAEDPTIFYDCHTSSGTTESRLAWGTKFADSVQVMKDYLSVHVRELIVVAPDNLHADLPDPEESWFAVFAEKFDTCFVVDESIQARHLPTRTETSCVRIAGRPSENITMGDLIDRNLRVIVWPSRWREMTLAGTYIHSTYGDHNVGAKSKDLLEVFQDYADGRMPLMPETLLSFQVIGAAAAPDFSMVDMSNPIDPIWPVVASIGAVKETDLRCVEKMAESYNTDLLQDDSNPFEYFDEKECPDSPCGCLGYRSPLEPIHQKLLDQGHSIQVINNDYAELGEKQSIVDLTRRMNQANLRRFLGQPELVKGWWDCHLTTVVAVVVPLLLVLCGACYATLVCLFPKRYGLWIRKAWERHQDARAQRRLGREQGREEALAYLRNANGGDGPVTMGSPVAMGVTSVAPPAAAAAVEYNQYNPNFPNYHYQAKETE